MFLTRQVDRDCELLEQERIMDYSLLVGVHFKDRCKDTLLHEYLLQIFSRKKFLQIFAIVELFVDTFEATSLIFSSFFWLHTAAVLTMGHLLLPLKMNRKGIYTMHLHLLRFASTKSIACLTHGSDGLVSM
jgi:hypothetical protein